MWPEFLHHITLHFPIVLSLGLALIATFTPVADHPPLMEILRLGGLLTLGFALVAAGSGIAAAGLSGGEHLLVHHRYLGILATLTIALAALSVHVGHRQQNEDLTGFGRLTWWAAAFATTGTAHWGAWAEHPDAIPF